MAHTQNLQLTPSGRYYLRSQRNCINRRISLRTKDLATAKSAAAIVHVTLSHMSIEHNKIKERTLETDGQNIKIQTEDKDADCASTLEAVEIIAASTLKKTTAITASCKINSQ